MHDWTVTDADRELFARELASFVPPRIFDAHAHLYDTAHFAADKVPALCQAGPKQTGIRAYLDAIGELTPNRTIGGLFFPFPTTEVDTNAANEFLSQQMNDRPLSRGQMLVTPKMEVDFIRQSVRDHRFVGLKCYHVFSPAKPTFDSPIEDFLPESQAKLAGELGLSITLHMVRSRALADPVNQETIRRYATRYRGMRLILAHAARGFNPHHTIEGIASLRGLENVWFDTSVVTDAGAFEAIIQTMGHKRLMYGSDFPVSHLRGRCVAIGDSFHWISAENTRLDAAYAKIELSLVGLESLRTIKVAARSLRLTDSQVEDIFHNNAAEMFGL